MWPAATYLNQYAARDLAIYFSRLPPRAANDGDKGLAFVGRRIKTCAATSPMLADE